MGDSLTVRSTHVIANTGPCCFDGAGATRSPPRICNCCEPRIWRCMYVVGWKGLCEGLQSLPRAKKRKGHTHDTERSHLLSYMSETPHSYYTSCSSHAHAAAVLLSESSVEVLVELRPESRTAPKVFRRRQKRLLGWLVQEEVLPTVHSNETKQQSIPSRRASPKEIGSGKRVPLQRQSSRASME